MTALAQTIKIFPGWDNRDKNESYHGCELLFILRGEKGVLTFTIATDWAPMQVQQQYMNGVMRTNIVGVQPVPVNVKWHTSKEPSIPQMLHKDCPYLDRCFSNTSPRSALLLRDILLKEGSLGVWRNMGQLYRSYAGITQNGRK